MALDYDYLITSGATSLGFNKLVSQDTPEERATAQFRKDQYDSAADVGDQSLVGWWTRGQLSFHRGMGTRYYEVESTDAVLNTYAFGQGVDPFTPARLKPYRDMVSLSTLAAGAEVRCIAETVDSNTGGSADLDFAVTVHSDKSALVVLQDGTVQGLRRSFDLSSTKFLWACDFVDQGGATIFSTEDGILTSYFGLYAAGTITLPTYASNADHATDAGLDVFKVWSAKNRIFAVSKDGRWLTLAHDMSAAPFTYAAADVFWTSGLTPDTTFSFTKPTWTLADSPGPVYMAYGNRIFAVSLDDTGALPVLTSGITVGLLARGEYISDMKYNLGYLCLATNRGVRFAVVNGDGSLTVGPLAPALNKATSVDVWESTVLVAGQGAADGTNKNLILAFDSETLTSTSQPQFAYTAYWSGTASGYPVKIKTTTLGVLGYCFAWGDASASSTLRDIFSPVFKPGASTTYTATKELVTAFHRMGTLEEKAFRFVDLRLSPSPGAGQVIDPEGAMSAGGSVAVYAVQLDGTQTLLGSVSASTAAATLAVNITAEALALRFVLTASGSAVPFLTGYQLRSLPAPKRQRMKRVPLMLFDREENRRGQTMGTRKSGWSRLQALEALEQSSAVVSFEDKETGETGTGYIESVEMRRTAPTSRDGDGFGGTVWLTLRVI